MRRAEEILTISQLNQTKSDKEIKTLAIGVELGSLQTTFLVRIQLCNNYLHLINKETDSWRIHDFM